MHLRIPNPVQAYLEEAQAPFRRLHLRQHFARMGRRFNISSHAPLPIVWAHPSVEGEPIEVTDPPKETRGVHNQLQNVHTGGEGDAWNIDGLPNLPVSRSK